jgi:hypothetical protein
VISMEYEQLDHIDFDAMVTGELTHYALRLEDELNWIICEYFVRSDDREGDFRPLILYREGLTFQDKIEIVRSMIPVLGHTAKLCNLKSILKGIEEFKSWRNALVHGLDYSNPEEPRKIVVEVVTRSGKEKRIEITPASHREMMERTEKLLEEVEEARVHLRESFEVGA